MPTQVGTYDISTLLATRYSSAADFGMDTINTILQADIAAHNAVVTEMMMDLADVSPDRQRIYGTSAAGEMVEVDEYGRSATQKAAPGTTVAFPLKLYQYGIGWTRKYMQTATPADLAIRTQAAQSADLAAIRREIKKALYLSSNYTAVDRLVDNVSLAVKRLVNADSAGIPNGPDGSTFTASTHTHYDAINGLTAASLTAAINDLTEHGHGARVMVAVAAADAATVSALTGFVAAQPAYLAQFPNTLSVPIQRTDLANQFNRLLGYFNAAEVWVKPWAIANYLFVWDAGSPMKPLLFRQRAGTTMNGLQIAATIDAYPLYAEYMEREMGLGVWTRTNGVVLYFGAGTYADPTIS
ncbi:MAG: hypothetical protein H7Y32_12855 [Chloroflexales bacterium]|nr:hypothetical protein [Chloroflexales bacterium]